MLTQQTKIAILCAPSKQLRDDIEVIKSSLNPTVVEMCRFITSVLAGRNKQHIVARHSLTQDDLDAMTTDWAAVARTEQDTEYREQLAAEFEEASARHLKLLRTM